jgi:nucleoside-diphosphate-sugar epimerase
MSRYLVTGGAGFIGSHIAGELVQKGHSVRIIDNFSTGKRENISSFLDEVELVEADIREFRACREVVEGMDFVLHQAALTSVPLSIENSLLTNEINITGTLNLLVASRDAKVQRLIFASSAAVYGDDSRLPKTENMEGVPISPYALSKRVGELYCRLFTQLYGLSTVCLRYFNIFGPRQDPFSQYASVIPNFIRKMTKGKKPTVFGDGEQSRDFLYVSNVVDANILASQASKVSGEVFNIAGGEKTAVNSLVEELNKVLNKEIKPSYDDPRPGDIKHSYADISKAGKMLKYKPTVSFSEGLSETVRWYREGKRQ